MEMKNPRRKSLIYDIIKLFKTLNEFFENDYSNDNCMTIVTGISESISPQIYLPILFSYSGDSINNMKH